MLEGATRKLGRLGVKYLSSYTKPLKEEIVKSNLTILFEIYLGRMLLISIISFIGVFAFVTAAFIIFGMPPAIALLSALIASITTAFFVFTINYSYPFHLLTTKKASIEANSPFVINHMGAIAASGVPPFVIFKLISNIPEYEEIANECKRIVRNVETFGMDLVSAVANVAERTPSEKFRQFLSGFVSITNTGGNLQYYLENEAKEALFNYRLRREKYLQQLSTYADLYTAVLIAAPLFFVSILSILSLVGGSIFGLPIETALKLGIYTLIPILNIMFIAFVHYTSPRV
ncbi:MAG: type II secretion system F family protein [Candidatus Aenigmarchaeota archaeon]|nr:type II secretion system F family protein [Candidatus Aenigmarchaeota archaeon]